MTKKLILCEINLVWIWIRGDGWTFKPRSLADGRSHQLPFLYRRLWCGGGGLTLMDELCGVSLYRSPNLIDSCTLHLITADIRARVARRAVTCRPASVLPVATIAGPINIASKQDGRGRKNGVYVFIPRDSDVWLHIIKAIASAAATHWSISGRHVAATERCCVTSRPDQLLCTGYPVLYECVL